MTILKIRKRIIFPSILAMLIFVNGVLATNNLLLNFNSFPDVVRQVTKDINLSEDFMLSDNLDEKKADEYAVYAEKLNDLVNAGKMAEKVRENLLDTYDSTWV